MSATLLLKQFAETSHRTIVIWKATMRGCNYKFLLPLFLLVSFTGAFGYDRDLSDVLKVESDIARTLADEIRLTLTNQVNQRLAAATPVNPAAHDAYLQGLQGWNQRSRDGFLQAIADFNRATELDPNYAPAFAGLARVYSLAPVFAAIAPSEAAPKGLEAANRALALDESLADAHSALGFVKGHYQYDWPSAEREFQRAVELEPNNTYSHFFYSNSFLSPFGRHLEAIAEMRKAMNLDPVSPAIQSFAGITFIWARHYSDALAQFQKADRLNPNFALNHERMARLYVLLSKYEEGIAEETKARLLAGETPQLVLGNMTTLRQEFASKGARGYWEEELRLSQNEPSIPEAYARPFGFAAVYCYLGDKDKALANLEIAYAQRDVQMTELAIDPEFDPLRSDARFTDLERRVRVCTGRINTPPPDKILSKLQSPFDGWPIQSGRPQYSAQHTESGGCPTQRDFG